MNGTASTPKGGVRLGRLSVPDRSEWPATVGELAHDFEAKLGFVPNVIPNFALLPEHFVRWWAYFDELMRGPDASPVAKRQRGVIAAVVSAANHCHY